MPVEFTLPELGENVEKGDVVRVLVSVGDMVEKDQPLLELETDKATIEVPSTVTGKVSDVRVKVGDKVKVGQSVLTIDDAGAGAQEAAPERAGAKAEPAPAKAEGAPASAPAGPQPQPDSKADHARKTTDEPEPPPAKAAAPVVDISTARQALAPSPAPAIQDGAAPVPAAPSVRRYARELGVAIAEVPGSGPGGRIGQEDVKQHVRDVLSGGGGLRPLTAPLPDFSKWGDVETKPMSNIRRKTAEHLSIAWQAPHVTTFDRADVTALEEFRKTYGPRVEKSGGKLTVTAILIKVVALALDRFPEFATSVDMANDAIVYKKYRHVGVAVDTSNGLLVPVLRDVDRKTLTEIAVELAGVSQKARDRKLSLDDMSGGVFTLSNIGGIGGTSFTPIVNQPEVAILGISRGATEPVWRDGQFVPRQLLPLSLSYDHRAIDGANGARFLRFIAEALEQPLSLYV
jgi:pyruvate dehydrogenase E2 component (dihydrolipoamide acetyltransferase)